MQVPINTPISNDVAQAKVFNFRLSRYVIAIYAIVCLCWVGFANWIAPNIIAFAYDERNLPIFNWVFHDGSLPVEHYRDRWNTIAAAALLAVVLHLVTVLFISGKDRKQRDRFLNAALPSSHINAALVIFSAAFLALAVLSGARGDYKIHLYVWTAILGHANPWEPDWILMPLGRSFYGPLFNVLAPLSWVNPLANKLLFAFSYLICVIWLIKDFAPRQGIAVSWPWLGMWVLNPYPWEQIAYFGYFDVLVALACVAAVHSLVNGKDGISGTYLALGILLKYMPIVILPFLAFSGRRFHFRLFKFCVGVVALGLVVSVLVWGTSTFDPLLFNATRESRWSIYNIMVSSYSPLRPFLDSSNIGWVRKSLFLTAGLGIFTWCMIRQIEPVLSSALALLVTFLFYWVGYANYQMVFFFLISYWAVANWAQLKRRSVLATLFVGYFSLLTISNLALWDLVPANFPTEETLQLFQFLLGCVLFFVLVQLRPPVTCARADWAQGENTGALIPQTRE
jgi:hypothetical protein